MLNQNTAKGFIIYAAVWNINFVHLFVKIAQEIYPGFVNAFAVCYIDI